MFNRKQLSTNYEAGGGKKKERKKRNRERKLDNVM